MKSDRITMGARQLLDAYRSRTLSPVSVAQAILDHIDAHNPTINAFVTLDAETTLRQAAASEERWARGAPAGPVDGVPVSIKDLLLTKGWPTLRGSRTTEPHQAWTEDSPSVARLRESGAVFIGKTTTPEFGGSGIPWSPLTGLTRNPWDLGRSCGASSSGAAVAAAGYFGPVAIGSDAMGSIRIPASFTGVYGFKPTFGCVPHYPYGISGDLGSIGPITRNVGDAALVMNVITQSDIRDWTAAPRQPCDYLARIDTDLDGLRVALSITMGFAEVDSEIEHAVREAAYLLRQRGAVVIETDPPAPDPFPIYDTIRLANRSTMVAKMTPEKIAVMDPIVANIAKRASSVTVAKFRSAMQQRAVYGTEMQSFLNDFDILLTPTVPVSPLPVTATPDDPESDEWYKIGGRMWAPFNLPFNLTHQPAASLPCGIDGNGLPIGLQIVAGKYRDALVMQVSHAFEQLLAFPSEIGLSRLIASSQ